LPLLQLCIHENHIQIIIGRRFGDNDEDVLNAISPNNNAMLVFPSDEAIELADGIKEIRRMHSNHKNMPIETNPSSLPTSNKDNDELITLIFLDATRKYAKKMYKKTSLRNAWLQNMLLVKLSLTSNSRYKPNRFNIRATPSLGQMSTAEYIAFVVSVIEDREELYDSLMESLYCMVNI